MNAAGRFSCLCCDAVKGILGDMRWEVGESHLQSRLGKVGGSGRIESTSGDLVSTWSDANLRIGFRLGQLLMTYYKFMRTQVGTSTGIEKRPPTDSQCAYLSLLSSSRTYNTSSAAAQVWFHSKVRIWPSRDQIPGCRLDPPPILPLYQVCSGDDFRRLLTAYCPECLSPHRSINMRSARLRSFPRIQAQLERWQQQQHNLVGACIVVPFVWISPAPPLAPSINCSTPRPSSIYSTISHKLFSPLLALYTNCIQSVNFRIILLGYVNEQVNMQGWFSWNISYFICQYTLSTETWVHLWRVPLNSSYFKRLSSLHFGESRNERHNNHPGLYTQ